MDSDRPKKVYELTNDGKALLDYTAGSLRSIVKSIGKDCTHATVEADNSLELKLASGLK